MTQPGPAVYDLRVVTGSTLRAVFEWKDPDGTPIDLTGYRVLFQFRPFAGSVEDPLVEFDSDALTTGQDIEPLDITGTIEFTLADELTAEFPADILAWDLFVESPSGARDCILVGKVFVTNAVTRD